jgi:hypothetical protein
LCIVLFLSDFFKKNSFIAKYYTNFKVPAIVKYLWLITGVMNSDEQLIMLEIKIVSGENCEGNQSKVSVAFFTTENR